MGQLEIVVVKSPVDSCHPWQPGVISCLVERITAFSVFFAPSQW
jgi:hypothetical protein